MKHPVVLMLLTLFSWCAHAQEDSIQQRIFLIGDGGELHNGKQVVVDWLKKNVDWNDTRNVAIYLGDNIYPLGLPMEGEEGYGYYKRILDSQITRLEQEIDLLNAEMEPLTSFVLPAGSPAAAALHMARTVCRRAERTCVALSGMDGEIVGPPAIKYLNRLSDLLFVAARWSNDKGRADVLWKPGATR